MTGARARVSAQYWIEIAARALARHGPDALTIDALCRATRKTKGSFYAHFGSHDAFLGALAAFWRELTTEAVMRAVDGAAQAQDRLACLNQLAIAIDPRFDQGMRKLADRSPLIREAVTAVDAMRIAYLAALYEGTGKYAARDAKDLATIEYAAYVGLQQIGPDLPPGELQRLYDAFMKLTARP
jgi:AcrR family transcriptional regulator